jgi:hypothetical protein
METLEVKPRFRFSHRSAGRYYWEPVNDEARAHMMTAEESTAVRWFWGDRFGMDVAVAAHDRAGELGMTHREYREHVKGLAAETRKGWRSLTGEELAELIPAGSWPAGMTDTHAARAAYVEERREMDRELSRYLSADAPEPRVNLITNPWFDGATTSASPYPWNAARQYAAGGAELTFTRAAGGIIPSPVPAPDAIKLSEGSYRVPESTLRRYGRAFLDRLNGARA